MSIRLSISSRFSISSRLSSSGPTLGHSTDGSASVFSLASSSAGSFSVAAFSSEASVFFGSGVPSANIRLYEIPHFCGSARVTTSVRDLCTNLPTSLESTGFFTGGMSGW